MSRHPAQLPLPAPVQGNPRRPRPTPPTTWRFRDWAAI